MKTRLLSSILAFILLISAFSSCDLIGNDNENGNGSVDHYLVSYEEHKTYLTAFVTSILSQVSGVYPEVEDILDAVEHDITVYKITYTTKFNGEDKLASGLVCVPNGEGSFPVLSYQNGTNTLHSKAPSVDPENQLFLLLEFMASTGFVVTIPDYLGFGASDDMFHPYLDKESTVQTIIDMQFAVEELVENYLDIELNKDLYISGYSQGGWATLQLQKAIEDNYATQFNLKASACGAGPYDLNFINDYVLSLTDYPMPYFLGYIFNSYYNLGGITTPIGDIFQTPYDEKIMTLYDGSMAGEAINQELTIRIADLFTSDFIENYKTAENYSSLIATMEANSIDAWKTTTPTILLHGTEDTFVPPTGTGKIFQGFMLAGISPGDVVMIPLQGEDHQSGIVPSGVASMKWFLDLKNSVEM